MGGEHRREPIQLHLDDAGAARHRASVRAAKRDRDRWRHPLPEVPHGP